MNRTTISAIFVLAVSSVAAVAQMGTPTPAPELKKLDYFAGNWSYDATVASGPWGSGGKFTAADTAEWLKGSFFLVHHTHFSLPAELGGSGGGLAIMGYDNDKKVYTEERFDSSGRHEFSTGTVSGDTWTWRGENNYNGMMIRTRITIKVVSPTSFTSKYEVSTDGANWTPFYEGKGTKK